MGTRGIYGFRLDEKDYLSYNHFDSYPSGLGMEIVGQVNTLLGTRVFPVKCYWCGQTNELDRARCVGCGAPLLTNVNIEILKERVRNIVMVSEDEPPSDEVKDRTREFHDFGVSGQNEDDPYCLFRRAQGNIIAALQMGLMLDARDFIKDSLFCEWGYIVNLDTEMLEVWRGFQKHSDPGNRYGQEKDQNYYPCKMVASFPLTTVTEKNVLSVEEAY